TFPVQYTTTPIRRDGELAGAVLAFRDISPRVQAEQEAQQLATSLSSIVENIPDVVFVLEVPSLRVVRVNRAPEALFPRRREGLHGRSAGEVLPHDEAEHLDALARKALSRGSLVEAAALHVTTATERVPRLLHIKIVPCGPDGSKTILLVIGEDIT